MELLSHADLAALSLLNRATHSLIAPYLYSDFSQELSNGRISTFVYYLRTVLERPDLAAQGRYVTLIGGFQSQSGDEPWVISTAGLNLEQSQLAIDDAGLATQPFATEWKHALEQGVVDAMVALLLLKLPNLEYLKMEQTFTKQCPLLGHLLRAVVHCQHPSDKALPYLRHLDEVDYTHWPPDSERRQDGKNTADLLPFFYLTNVRYLSVALDNPEVFSWPLPTTPDASNLTFLSLTFLREEHLGHILELTSNLRTLEWQWYYNKRHKHSTNLPIIDLDIISVALCQVKHTLTKLSLFACVDYDVYTGECPLVDLKGSLECLHKFPLLRTVNAPMPLLVGGWKPESALLNLQDVIPKNIREMTINDDLYPHCTEVQRDMEGSESPVSDCEAQNGWNSSAANLAFCSWALVWPESHPDLEVVTYSSNGWCSLTDWDTEDMFEAGRRHGVKVKVVQYDTTGTFWYALES